MRNIGASVIHTIYRHKGKGINMLDFLTDNLRRALTHVNLQLVYELRVRANKPVVINYGGKYTFLGTNGTTEHIGAALVCSFSDIETIIYRASEFSVYSVTEQLRQGFLTGSNGERIGLAGIFVYENGKTFTVKEVSSLNIRVPHEVPGCGELIERICFREKIGSALLISPPGRGKTTILRDLTRLISSRRLLNILINDERNEISAAYRDFSLNTGAFSDVVRYSYKSDALSAAVRAMRPDLIVTDELVSAEEIEAVAACIRGGVCVIASAHLRDISAMQASPVFGRVAEERLFDYYIALSADEIGKVAGIYGKDLAPVYETC